MSSMSGVQASGVPPSAGSGSGDCNGWKNSEADAVSIAPLGARGRGGRRGGRHTTHRHTGGGLPAERLKPGPSVLD